MRKIFYSCLIFIFAASFMDAQQTTGYRMHPFSGTLVFSLEGGLDYAFTDYNDNGAAPALRFSTEYFLPVKSNLVYGARAFLGYEILTGSGKTGWFLEDEPETFRTPMILLGAGPIISYSINDKYFPYFFPNLSVINFNPKDSEGNLAPGNSVNRYKEVTYSVNTEFGFRFLVAENISVNLNTGLHFVQDDNLDDRNVGESNDFYISGLAGVSISLFGKKDSDKDGLYDNEDSCPDQPEDFDGYEDEDGCPDLDNDNDRIRDTQDQCPEEAEDYDGFQDEDGCPDPDNDGDGIVDVRDGCPNQAEDFDGFKDEDGCPDPDNDSDGIEDELDECPNEAEVFNGFEDNDGCPDSVAAPEVEAPVEEIVEPEPQPQTQELPPPPSRFLLHGTLTFDQGSSELKSEAIGELNKIVTILRRYPETRWRVEGHMGSEGTENEINQLSSARAQAVMSYLIDAGISPTRLAAVGLGDKYPIADNNTVYGRMRNQRVVVRLVR